MTDNETQKALSQQLSAACFNGNVKKTKELLNQGANPNLGSGKELPLSMAVIANATDVVECLLNNGADPNAVNAYGNTPFFHAIASGKEQMVKMMLPYDADCQTERKADGKKPSEVCAGNTQIHELIEGQIQLNDQLWTAVTNKSSVVVAILLEAGANPNGRKPRAGHSEDRRPLSMALNNKDFETAKVLLSGGANPSLLDGARRTCLHEAAAYGNEELISLMCHWPTLDINATDAIGNTPLHVAATIGNASTADALLNRNAKTDIENNHKKTALDISEEDRHGNTITVFRKHNVVKSRVAGLGTPQLPITGSTVPPAAVASRKQQAPQKTPPNNLGFRR